VDKVWMKYFLSSIHPLILACRPFFSARYFLSLAPPGRSCPGKPAAKSIKRALRAFIRLGNRFPSIRPHFGTSFLSVLIHPVGFSENILFIHFHSFSRIFREYSRRGLLLCFFARPIESSLPKASLVLFRLGLRWACPGTPARRSRGWGEMLEGGLQPD
jgi:hypothetical protein